MYRILFLIFSSVLFQIDDPPDIINPYRNINQLILIFSPGNKYLDYELALQELSKDPLGLDQRDLVIFEIFPKGGILPDGKSLSEEDAGALRLYYDIEIARFTMIIVDKHQTEVYRSTQPVPLTQIFKSID
jgi:hypothetical protein